MRVKRAVVVLLFLAATTLAVSIALLSGERELGLGLVPPNTGHQLGLNETSTESRSCTAVAINASCLDNCHIKVYLYTRTSQTVGQLLDLSGTNLNRTSFNASHPTKILLHGYNSGPNLFALVDMRTAYLRRGQYNVLVVDWEGLAQGPILCYPTAIRNGRHVGKCVGQLVKQLGAADDVHVIGVSLGAHVASYVADNVRPQRLARITGLDPALPLFVTADNDARLDAGDAIFVDVLHTNAFFQGQVAECGHIDFYVNGGSSQPGCGVFHLDSSTCSHLRAAQYFAESVSSAVGFYGWRCASYVSYALGLCAPSSDAVLMGEDVDHRNRGFVQVTTGAVSPFALGPWRYRSTRSSTGSALGPWRYRSTMSSTR